ncbi:MAG: polysaccharide biosynthesis C-terminal domain-containing protein [Phycisphaerae bacterium]|nr:polysaccharide biosynthesis C-terminal domain-containing protein [Phycisphaerae bacterium]
MSSTPPTAGEEQTWATLRRGSDRTFVLLAVDTGLRVATGIFLARWLGASGYGAYMYATSWVLILSVPAQLGSARLVVRAVAAELAEGRTGHLRGRVRGGTGLVLAAAVLLAAIVGIVFGALVRAGDDAAREALLWALPMVPLGVVMIVQRAALEGLDRVVRGQVPQRVVQPALFGGLVVGAAAVGMELSATHVVLLAGLTFAVTLIVGAGLLWPLMPARTGRSSSDGFDPRAWLRQSLPMVLLAASQVVNMRLDVVMLGLLGGVEDAGVYGVVTVGASLLTLVLGASGRAFAPLIVRLRALGEHATFQRLVTRSMRRTMVITIAGAVAMLAIAPWALPWLGAEYARGWTPLSILCAAQVVNVGAGMVVLILVMSHHERDAAAGLALGAGANLALNLALIPPYGIIGAAVATLLSTTVWNGLLIWRVRRRLGIDPTVLGRRARR